MPQDYNQTLNLPKTDFPMRAGLPQREPGFLKEWDELGLYQEILKKNAGRPKYVLHDGPPFSNNNIHLGTALNKILKDFVNRYKAVSGYNMTYVPGWDNHGMPIESAIIKQNKLNRKSMSIPEFRDACRDFAQHFVEVQKQQFIRLGIIGEWDRPYLTMSPEFEAEEVRVFGAMFQKGYIYKDLKPIYWCINDETALAEAEIEYAEDPCTSIFVKFAVNNDNGKLAQYGDVSKMFFVIWTTTPWTLPGNMAIALHGNEPYVLARAENGEIYITAEALLESTMKQGGIAGYEVLATLPGREFELMTARHPFLNRDSLIALADYVTMDSGTGCVHTAPGYGADDFHTGRKYGIKLIVPIDDKGRQTEEAGMFAGLRYDESDKAITAWLDENGYLFAKHNIVHTYPHCWRCKDPILFRAMPQWFCSIEAFRDAAIDACKQVTWLPEWGGDRIVSMIVDRDDWCISRQRHWGLPIPVFYCGDCKKPVCTPESIDAVAALFEREGSSSWYIHPSEKILPQGFVCPHCGGVHFEKETDTLDGWFDSGATNIASLEKDNAGDWPADMYLEGADQYRGWFQSSLLIAVATKDKGAPYRTVLTHGWVVDGEGKQMHKSAGNSVLPETVIDQYGADLLRLWVASSDYQVDIRASDSIFKQLSQTYLKIRNTSRYILGNLEGFDPNNLVAPDDMLPLDRWAMTKLNALIEKVTAAYESYDYHIVSHSINNFCVVDMSNFYLDVIKDRLYCDDKDGLSRRSAQTAMFLILDSMTRMLSVILAFTSNEIWLAMPHRDCDDARHVMLNDLNKPFTDYALDSARMGEMNMLVNLRDDINAVLEEARATKIIGKPLEAAVTLCCEPALEAKLIAESGLLKTMLIVSGLRITRGAEGKACEHMPGVFAAVARAEGEKCERCWKYEDSVGKQGEHETLCGRCAEVLKNM